MPCKQKMLGKEQADYFSGLYCAILRRLALAAVEVAQRASQPLQLFTRENAPRGLLGNLFNCMFALHSSCSTGVAKQKEKLPAQLAKEMVDK